MSDSIVVDASIAAAWSFPDEHHDLAAHLFAEKSPYTFLVPDLFWHEVRNMTQMGVRRNRFTYEVGLEVIHTLRIMNIRTQNIDDDETILTLAIKHKLTTYDSTYLALALREKARVATLDKSLTRASQSEICDFIS